MTLMSMVPQSLVLTIAYLRNVHEPLAPMWFTMVVLMHVVHNFGEIQLWSVPTANPIISTKIPLDFELVRGASIPLKQSKNASLFSF